MSSLTSSIALKAALGIGERWRLSDSNLAILLGGISVSTLRRWARQLREGQVHPRLKRDQLDRISYILNIYRALHTLFPDSAQADSWVNRPNQAPGFNGRSALEVMLRGSMKDLQDIQRYLDAWCV